MGLVKEVQSSRDEVMSVKVVVKITETKDGSKFHIDRKNWFPTKIEHDAAVWLCTSIRDTLLALKEKEARQ